MLKYVAQRGDNDCGIAALAIACGVTYEAIATVLQVDGDGLNDTLLKDWLFRNGWSWQERTRNLWRGGSYVPLFPWPPEPFALTHICTVEATRGWHYCVLDFEGRVYDPWKRERGDLSHPDYKRVSTVLGLFKLPRRSSGPL